MRFSASRRARAAAIAVVALVPLAAAPATVHAQDSAVQGTALRDSAARRPFRPADVYRIVTVGAPAMSPDGRRVAFTVTTVDERANRRHTEVWTASTAGGAPARLSWPDSESTAPRFLPDGRLVFNAGARGARARPYAVRIGDGDAQPVRAEGLPPAGASWSRDGRVAVWADSIVPSSDSARGEFSRADSAMRDPTQGDTVSGDTTRRVSGPGGAATRRAMSRPPYSAITRPLDQARFDGRHVVDFPYKNNDRGFVPNRADARRWNPTQLWTAAGGDTARRQLTTAAYSHRDAALSPDGRTVAFVADTALRPDSVVQAERDSIARLPYDRARDNAERNEVDVYVQQLAGCPTPAAAPAARPAADSAAKARPCEPRKLMTLAGVESELAWSPDGRSIAFLWRPARTRSTTLATVDVATGRVRDLLGNVEWEPENFVWLNDRLLATTAQVGGRTAMFRLGSGGGGAREVLGGRRRMSGFSFDRDRNTVVYVSTSMTRPTELYVATTEGTNERKVTSFNDALLGEVAMSDAERFTYPSVGGLTVEGWLMRPAGYDSTKRYPLALYIHGGPHSSYGENWFDEFQNLAGAGMMVLFTNPRGSSGYGGKFTYATRGRWGMEDFQDLMKAVDLAAARPDVDSTRMGVTGGSYGGFMTAWITTKTNRFKAAQTDRMISDWTSWYGASDAQGLTEFEFYGKPWDNQPLYDNLSPIRWVKNVRTPTLIVQSEEDHRTPMVGAEMWFMALRKQGVPAEFVRYPRSTHELSRSGEPWLLVDRLGRLRQWFSHWLIDAPPAQAASGATPGTPEP